MAHGAVVCTMFRYALEIFSGQTNAENAGLCPHSALSMPAMRCASDDYTCKRQYGPRARCHSWVRASMPVRMVRRICGTDFIVSNLGNKCSAIVDKPWITGSVGRIHTFKKPGHNLGTLLSCRRPELKPGTGSDTSICLENRCCKWLYAKIKAPILLRGKP